MKIRNYFFSSCAAITAMALGVCIVSCSDDDDQETRQYLHGVLDKASGLRVKQVDDYTYYYADNGRIDSICDDGCNNCYVFKYNPNRIIGISRGEVDELYTVDYNSSGYLTVFGGSWRDSFGEWSYSGNYSFTLRYDGDGHLVKMSGNGKESSIGPDSVRYDEDWTQTTTLTWDNNKLMKVVLVSNSNDDDEPYTETREFSYDDGNYVNEYRQWTPSLADDFGDDIALLFYAGMMGVGPTMLPTSVEETNICYEDGESDTVNNSYTYRYGFDDNGSVSYSTIKDKYGDEERYDFTYDYAGDNSGKGTRSEVSQLPVSGKKLAHRFGRMLKR